MRVLRYILPALVLLLFPTTVWANAGTALMWAAMGHLVIGNAIIGAIEGALLARFFECSKARAVSILTVGNYVSAWAGLFIISYVTGLPDITIENVRGWLVLWFVAAFCLTLVIEFPFVCLALRPRPRLLRDAWRGALIVNGISYALLSVWYVLPSGTSMVTRLKVVPPSEMRPPEAFALYYLSVAGDMVYRMDLPDGKSKQAVYDVDVPSPGGRIYVRPSRNGGFDLLAHSKSDDKKAESLIEAGFSDRAAVEWRIAENPESQAMESFMSCGPVAVLVPDSEWKFFAGFWANGGIAGTHKEDGRRVVYALETPFAAWLVRDAVQLPGDYLVFQLGRDQICMLHPESRRIALLARGRSPVVAKPKSPGATQESAPAVPQ